MVCAKTIPNGREFPRIGVASFRLTTRLKNGQIPVTHLKDEQKQFKRRGIETDFERSYSEVNAGRTEPGKAT